MDRLARLGPLARSARRSLGSGAAESHKVSRSLLQTCSQTPRSRGLHSAKQRLALTSAPTPISALGMHQRLAMPQSVRRFGSSAAVLHNHLHKPKEGEELHVTFISKDGLQQTFEVAEGDNILDIAQSYNLDMEGACGGSCACLTCHVIIDPEFYDEIEEPDDDENDMLDLAFGLTETLRLGCQIKMTKELDGIRIALPAMTRNLQSRDFS